MKGGDGRGRERAGEEKCLFLVVGGLEVVVDGCYVLEKCFAYNAFTAGEKTRAGGGVCCAPLADIAVESLKIHRLCRLGAKPLLSVLVGVSD